MDHETCAACGFDGAEYSDAAVLDALRALGPRWQALITSGEAALTVRPRPDVWSAMEYAAHTRDILALHAFGVEQALTVDVVARLNDRRPPVGGAPPAGTRAARRAAPCGRR